MPKKVPKKVVVKEDVKGVSGETLPKTLIGELTLDLGRGDLNALRDKINETIRKING